MAGVRNVHSERALGADHHGADVDHADALGVEHLALEGGGGDVLAGLRHHDVVCAQLGGPELHSVEAGPGIPDIVLLHRI